MNKKFFIVMMMGLSSFSATVIADDVGVSPEAPANNAAMQSNEIDDNPFPASWYVSLNGGVAQTGDITKNGVTRSGFGRGAILAYGGYQFNENWAAELGLAYHSFKDGNYELYDLVAKLTMPMDDKNILFAKLGAALASLKYCQAGCQRDNKFAPFIGLGYGYQLSPFLRVTAEYNSAYVTSGMADGSLASMTLGLTYYFVG